MVGVVIGYFLLFLYVVTLLFITIFCLMQLHLLYHYLRYKRTAPIQYTSATPQETLPMVTIQLPIFNEQFVVERLMANITKLDYPRHKLQIQVLDDSTDTTLDISLAQVDKYKALGFDIEMYHRVDRSGYKAGALKAAMSSVKGEYIAIFDADFLPDSDFLYKTLPYFEDTSIGVVQTKWGHINERYSLLTRLQAFQLNVHFKIEQFGRYAANYLLQFNGTAGVWRKTTIEEAGGWEADTLTEDLDLSYRAQLKGWKIRYLEDVTSPAELPAEIHGLKSQQYRWMKGGAETAVKLLPLIWKSDLPWRQKFHSTLHLFSSSMFLAIFILGVISVPLLFLLDRIDLDLSILGVFLASTISIILVYYFANIKTQIESKSFIYRLFYFILLFPVFLSLSMSLALHNSKAVIQGLMRKQTAFIRTPKYNIVNVVDKIKPSDYLKVKITGLTLLEGFMSLYFLSAVIGGIVMEYTAMLPMHIALSLGYAFIFYLSVKPTN